MRNSVNVARFFLHPVLDKLRTNGGTVTKPDGTQEKIPAAGRPIYSEVEYIEIRVPGDNLNIPCRPARPDDRALYAQEYARFKAGGTDGVVGTPLATWPQCNRAQVEELAHFGVRTVEQLANLSDAHLQSVGPFRELQRKAKDAIALAQGSAPLESLRAENEALKKRLSALEVQATSGKKG